MKVITAAVIVVLAALPVWAASSGGGNYIIERDVLASAGNRATSSEYILESTLGQSAIIDISTGGGFRLEHGFWHTEASAPTVLGDVNGDDCVNVADLLIVRNNLGQTGSGINPPAADVVEDGIVNVADLLTVRNALGTGPGC